MAHMHFVNAVDVDASRAEVKAKPENENEEEDDVNSTTPPTPTSLEGLFNSEIRGSESSQSISGTPT